MLASFCPVKRNKKRCYILPKRKILLAIGKCLLAFRAEILILGFAIGKHIVLDYTSIAQASGFTAARAGNICICDGSSSGTKNVFLHDRHLSFYAISEKFRT